MALETRCLTSGAQFHTEITDTTVSVKVDLGIVLDISEEEAELLTRLLHNQFELVLRKYYERSPRYFDYPSKDKRSFGTKDGEKK